MDIRGTRRSRVHPVTSLDQEVETWCRLGTSLNLAIGRDGPIPRFDMEAGTEVFLKKTLCRIGRGDETRGDDATGHLPGGEGPGIALFVGFGPGRARCAVAQAVLPRVRARDRSRNRRVFADRPYSTPCRGRNDRVVILS